jgi:hypothetical protein
MTFQKQEALQSCVKSSKNLIEEGLHYECRRDQRNNTRSDPTGLCLYSDARWFVTSSFWCCSFCAKNLKHTF